MTLPSFLNEGKSEFNLMLNKTFLNMLCINISLNFSQILNASEADLSVKQGIFSYISITWCVIAQEVY